LTEPDPEPNLSHPRRAWRDAEAAYRSPWIYLPIAILATGAAIAGILLPEGAAVETKVILASASAMGLPLTAGAALFIVMLACAPRKRGEDITRARLDALEDKVQAPGKAALTTIQTEGGTNHFHIATGRQG